MNNASALVLAAAIMIAAAAEYSVAQVAGQPNRPPAARPALTPEQHAAAFLKALLARDERALYAYGPGFFISGKLPPATIEFLYKSDPKRGYRSVTDIAADGPLVTTIVPQADKNVVMVIYVPMKYKAGLKSTKFLESEWMKKYFACWFDTTDSQWRLYYNFCFDETDGPYPGDY